MHVYSICNQYTDAPHVHMSTIVNMYEYVHFKYEERVDTMTLQLRRLTNVEAQGNKGVVNVHWFGNFLGMMR